MGYIYDNNNSLRSLYERMDADGTIWIKARAHGALTAATPYLVYCGYDGPRTLALFDTGATAGSCVGFDTKYKVGVPNQAVSSDTDGWLQIGGYCASMTTSTVTATVGEFFIWKDASVDCETTATTTSPAINGFAIAYTSAEGDTAHDVYLLNKFVYGAT